MLAGSLFIEMSMNLARLASDMSAAKGMVSGAMRDINSAVSTVKTALGALGVGVSVAGFIALTKSAAETAGATAKMSDRFGIATESLTGMLHAANLAGISSEGFTIALRGIAKYSVEAAKGNAEARDAFARLDIQASEFIKLPMDEQLALIIDRLGKMENAAVRNATAQALMGRNTGQMMGLVAQGSEAFKKAAEDTQAWGLAINRVDAAKIELSRDAVKDAEAAVQGIFTTIA